MRLHIALAGLILLGCASSEHDAANEGAASDRAGPTETTPDYGGAEMDSAERHVAYPFECWSRSF